MDTTTLWTLMLGALCMVLGFVALLLTRLYEIKGVDSSSELHFSKSAFFKTNYPALIFVVVGGLIVYYSINSNEKIQAQTIAGKIELQKVKNSTPGNEEWVVSGRLVSSDGKPVDWGKGVLTLIAGSPEVTLYSTGVFLVKLPLRKGEVFESYVQRIDYSNDSGSSTIYPQREMDKYTKKDQSTLLDAATSLTRNYKPVTIQQFAQVSQ